MLFGPLLERGRVAFIYRHRRLLRKGRSIRQLGEVAILSVRKVDSRGQRVSTAAAGHSGAVCHLCQTIGGGRTVGGLGLTD